MSNGFGSTLRFINSFPLPKFKLQNINSSIWGYCASAEYICQMLSIHINIEAWIKAPKDMHENHPNYSCVAGTEADGHSGQEVRLGSKSLKSRREIHLPSHSGWPWELKSSLSFSCWQAGAIYISLLIIRCRWLSCQCNSRPSMALVNTVRLGLDKESGERKKCMQQFNDGLSEALTLVFFRVGR